MERDFYAGARSPIPVGYGSPTSRSMAGPLGMRNLESSISFKPASDVSKQSGNVPSEFNLISSKDLEIMQKIGLIKKQESKPLKPNY